MATVYLANDLKHDRKVALKVLHPELAATLGPERFLREIRLTARLQHPHILTVHDSGEAAGQLWYTMPFVEGESLREQLAREGELPVNEAVRLLRDVVDALAYAHQHGVVHRDIKPGNVLVSGHHAIVVDFGVAKAVSVAASAGSVTATGLALGTPAYMAPEQATVDPHTDHRADIYAIGAVAYEMLTGRPPFSGPTPQVVLLAHVTKSPEPIAALRERVPPALQAIVMRCLAKQPADRWQTTEELLHQLDALSTASGGSSPTQVTRAVKDPRKWALVGAGLLVLLGLRWSLWRDRVALESPADPHAVVVFPFRVSGADPSLAYLREGMVELLAVRLTGEGGRRAVDPSASLSAWRRAGGETKELDQTTALRAAQALGAGLVVEGSVVGSPGRLTLTAAVLGSSRDDARMSVEGPLDSLSELVDRLTAGVLAGGVERKGRLSQLTTASLPALRSYLEGQSLYRHGSYREAVSKFERALALDSSFALAGLGLANAAGWCCEGGDRGLSTAWTRRDRLGPADRTLVEALAGPRYPSESSRLERLGGWERAVTAAPDRPDAWYGLGDILYHWGFVVGLMDAWQRSERAFQRALELDSTFDGPLEHLVELRARAGDTLVSRRLVKLALAADSGSEVAGFLRWRLAVAKGDTFALSHFGVPLDRLPRQSLFSILIALQYDAIPSSETRRVVAALARRASTREERDEASFFALTTALNAGGPAELLHAADLSASLGEHWYASDEYRLLEAAFWGGDTAGAARAAKNIAIRLATPRREGSERGRRVAQLCALEQWRLSRGNLAEVDRSLSVLRHSDTLSLESTTLVLQGFCRLLLDAWQARLRRTGDAGPKLAALDSASRSGPAGWIPSFQHVNLLIAHLYQLEGDNSRALAALRRRNYFLGVPLYMSSYLREEGRLAALTGDRTGAIAAYRHYLALRDDPEPAVEPEVNEVRRELANLLAER